jgi:hypothetical protein
LVQTLERVFIAKQRGKNAIQLKQELSSIECALINLLFLKGIIIVDVRTQCAGYKDI